MGQQLNDSLGKPRRPSSAFSYFVGDKNIHVQEASEKWKVLSEAERNKYTSITLKNLEKYNSELLAWEEKMLSIGRSDVIRKSSPVLVNAKKSIRKKKQSNVDKR